MNNLSIGALLALAACGSDQWLKGQDPAGATTGTPTTAPADVDPGPKDDSTSSTTDPSSTSEPSEPAWDSVPCSLTPDPDRLDLCASGPYAATWGGQGYAAVQKAIDVSGPGDTIVVCPGTWTEAVTVTGGRSLEAADPTAGATVLDAHGGLHAIEITDGALIGLTVTGATDGAIVQTGSALTLQCATVDGNSASYGGGGLTIAGALTVSESMFAHNDAAYAGGAIDARYGTSVTITDSTFLDNDSGYEAGGIDLGEVPATLTRVTFDANHADESGGALVFGLFTASDLTVVDSVVRDNTSDYDGGGFTLGLWANDRIDVSGTEFTDNVAQNDGGAVAFESWGGLNAKLTNCTFSSNVARLGGALQLDGWFRDGGSLTLDTVTFEDNGALEDGAAFGTTGNTGAVGVLALGVTAYRNVGGPGMGAVVLQDDDELHCIGCDFGSGTTDNGPNDMVKGGDAYPQVGSDFTL